MVFIVYCWKATICSLFIYPNLIIFIECFVRLSIPQVRLLINIFLKLSGKSPPSAHITWTFYVLAKWLHKIWKQSNLFAGLSKPLLKYTYHLKFFESCILHMHAESLHTQLLGSIESQDCHNKVHDFSIYSFGCNCPLPVVVFFKRGYI